MTTIHPTVIEVLQERRGLYAVLGRKTLASLSDATVQHINAPFLARSPTDQVTYHIIAQNGTCLGTVGSGIAQKLRRLIFNREESIREAIERLKATQRVDYVVAIHRGVPKGGLTAVPRRLVIHARAPDQSVRALFRRTT